MISRMDGDFQILIKLHSSKYLLFKESKQYELAIKEIETIVSILAKALLSVIPIVKDLKSPQALVTVVTFEDVVDPKKNIVIDKFGNLKVKT